MGVVSRTVEILNRGRWSLVRNVSTCPNTSVEKSLSSLGSWQVDFVPFCHRGRGQAARPWMIEINL